MATTQSRSGDDRAIEMHVDGLEPKLCAPTMVYHGLCNLVRNHT